MAEFDELNENINKLISELRSKKDDNTELSSISDFTQTAKGYEQYFKDIQSNTKGINETLNSYLKNINMIETKDEDVEIEETPSINYGIEEKLFVDYNEELKRLVQKISDLSLQLDDIKSKVNIDVDFNILDDIAAKIKENNLQSLEEIKEKIDNTDFNVNINTEEISNELSLLSSKLKELELPINVDTNHIKEAIQMIGQLKNSLSMEDLSLDKLDLSSVDQLIEKLNSIKETEFNLGNIDEFIGKLNSVKDITLNINANEIDETINKIQNIQDVDINLQISENITEIEQRLNEFRNVNVDLELNMDSILSDISDIQIELDSIKEVFGAINIDANINISSNIDEIKTNIEDLKATIQDGLSDFDFKIKPTIEVDNNNIKLNVTGDPMNMKIPESTNNENQIKDNDLKDFLTANTEAILQLQTTLSKITESQTKVVANESKKESDTKGSSDVMKVNTVKETVSMEDLMKQLIASVNTMTTKQNQMLVELKKSNFLKNND